MSAARLHRPTGLVPAVLLVALASGCIEDPATQQKRAEQERAQEILAEGRGHTDPYVRAETIRLLSYTPEGNWKADAEKMLQDPDPMVSLEAASALLRAGSNDAALATLERWATGDNPRAAVAAIEVASERVGYEPLMGLLNRVLGGSQSDSRQAAVRAMVDVLEQGKTPETKEARKLEQRLGSLATDTDTGVAVTALRYLSTVSRLVNENQDRRSALEQVARDGTLEHRRRALSILVALGDARVRGLVQNAFADARSNPELAGLEEVALLGLATVGVTDHIAEVDKMVVRDGDLAGQKAALTALTHVETPDALQSLNQALDSPNPEIRLHVLAVAKPLASEMRIPDVLLKDTVVDVRVAALQMMFAQGKARFDRVIKQKLDVPEFRAPLLTGLAEWAESDVQAGGGKVPAWLTDLAPTLQELKKQYGDNEAIGAPLFHLLCLLDGPKGYMGALDELPHTARYMVMRLAIEGGIGAPDSFRKQLESPYFAVRLAAAVGTVKGQR